MNWRICRFSPIAIGCRLNENCLFELFYAIFYEIKLPLSKEG
ncbi:hypothetical protein LEP1GSC061_3937 [Leptospira wolffii serovar Khorat str. Khorat-H2]|nr:hypothetical protein LEP1GSC061_3937 [Leptospira wolffii serovar Khorat str. Khorat-H2]